MFCRFKLLPELEFELNKNLNIFPLWKYKQTIFVLACRTDGSFDEGRLRWGAQVS